MSFCFLTPVGMMNRDGKQFIDLLLPNSFMILWLIAFNIYFFNKLFYYNQKFYYYLKFFKKKNWLIQTKKENYSNINSLGFYTKFFFTIKLSKEWFQFILSRTYLALCFVKIRSLISFIKIKSFWKCFLFLLVSTWARIFT